MNNGKSSRNGAASLTPAESPSMNSASTLVAPGAGPLMEDIQVRDRLISAAAKLFTIRGYAATSVQEIVEAAGVTKPVLYYYFQNKEGLYLHIIKEAHEQFEKLLTELASFQGSATEHLREFCRRFFALYRSRIDVVRLFHSVYYGPPQGAPFFDFDVFHKKIHAALHAIVEDGIASGEFRTNNPDDVAMAMFGLLNTATDMELVHPELGIGPEGLERLLRLLFTGIAAESSMNRS